MHSDALDPTCPRCGEDRLVEYVADRGVYVCLVCSTNWPGPPSPDLPPQIREALIDAIAAALVSHWRQSQAAVDAATR